MPFHSFRFPVFVPLFLCTRTNKELHFHLFKFPHTENELPCDDLITKCFSYLCNTKRNFHPSCFLHIQKVYKYALSCFRTQVNGIVFFGRNSTKFCGEHEIELANICPVAGTAYC